MGIRTEANNEDTEIQLSEAQKERIKSIDDRISKLTEQMEELGDEGKVEEANNLLKIVESLELEREEIKTLSNNSQSFNNQKLYVCDVCCALLVENDTTERVNSHTQGKIHQGYQLIREKITKLSEKLDKKKKKSKENGEAADEA